MFPRWKNPRPAPGNSFGFRVARIARRLRQAVDSELGAYGLTEATRVCHRTTSSIVDAMPLTQLAN